MATYLPNSNDYIPKSKSYTPDFKFLSDVLGRRQDRYNTNFKQLNELYGKVVHADLSHEDNIHIRDEYANLLVPKIQQITGTDFSLQQNADAARALFKPFFEDKTLVRDIVYTKRYNGQMGIAENLKTNPEKKERDKYFEDGVSRLQYGMQDFKEGSREEIMNQQMPEYVENPDLLGRAKDFLMNYEGEGEKYTVSDIVFSDDGKWLITQENGSLLTHKPTGIVDEKTGLMGTYNPAANLISTLVANDPLVARGYGTTAYVRARQFYENEDNITKYGSKEGAERFWLQNVIDQTIVKTKEVIDKEVTQKKEATMTGNSWDNYMRTNPNQNTETIQEYRNALAAITAIDEGISKSEVVLNDISRNGTDINELRNIGYQAFMHKALSTDIYAAAAQYAQSTKKVTDKELNPVWEKELDWQYKKKEIQLRALEARKTAVVNKSLLPPVPGLNLDARGITSEKGNADINRVNTGVTEGDHRENQNAFISERMNDNVDEMLESISLMYGNLGPSWSKEDGTDAFNSTGMSVRVFEYDDGSGYQTDGNPNNKKGKWGMKLLTWEEAKTYYKGQGKEQPGLKDTYNKMLNRYQKQRENTKSLEKPMFNELNQKIGKNKRSITNRKMAIIDMVDEGNKVYNEAYKVILTQNPEIKNWMDDYNTSMFNDQTGEPVMLSETEFVSTVKEGFIKKVNELGLPQTLKTREQVIQEAINDPSSKYYKTRNAGSPRALDMLYQQYLYATLQDAANKLGVRGYQDIVKQFYTDISFEGRKKPSSQSDEQWERAIKFTRQQNVNRMRGTLVLQSEVPTSNLSESALEIYNNTSDAMNEGMLSSEAGNGFPTYNAQREYMIQDQGDDGTEMITDSQGASYIHGSSTPQVDTQVELAFNSLMRLDQSMITVRQGNPETHGENGILTEPGVWGERMEPLIDQIRMDLSPGSDANPNFHISWNENINGKSGWVVQLDQLYVNKLRSTNTDDFGKLLSKKDISDNTFTIYVDKDQVDNPMNISNMYISNVKRTIEKNPNNEYFEEVPLGGSLKAWYGTNNRLWVQAGAYVYDFENKKFSMQYSKANLAEINGQPMTDRQIDDMFENGIAELNRTATSNRIQQNKATE